MYVAWLSLYQADVPPGDAWLGRQEREAMARFAVPGRRADWRLGRWTAKAALAPIVGVPPERLQILAADDGAPEVWLDGERVPTALSLSHRGGRALVAVTPAAGLVGCDLEMIEPRSPAFIAEWLTPEEQRLADDCAAGANLLWAAKESAAKVRRQGLALDPRHAVVTLVRGEGAWQPLRVDWSDLEGPAFGWWRTEPGWVMVVAGTPAPAQPRPADTGRYSAGPPPGRDRLRGKAADKLPDLPQSD